MCRITWGVILIFQNGVQQFCIKSSIEFFTIILSFLWKKNMFRNSHFPVRSVFVFNVSLITSFVCYCPNGYRRKHGKCSLCNEWWHSFMNQRLNHLVLLYKGNCIRIMSLNTCIKNVWRYCNTFHSNPWFRKTISYHKYKEWRIEVYDK